MKTICRSWGLALLLLACLAGCENGGHIDLFGYTTRPTFDESIRTVYVPIAQNVSYAKNIEFDLTQAVITALNSTPGAPRVTSSRSRADTELVMKIVTPKKDTPIINQLGEAREVELTWQIELVWRDLRPGHVGDILSNKKRFDPNQLPLPGDGPPTAPKAVPMIITPLASYAPEVGGSNVSAQAQLARNAARQVVHMMEVWR